MQKFSRPPPGTTLPEGFAPHNVAITKLARTYWPPRNGSSEGRLTTITAAASTSDYLTA